MQLVLESKRGPFRDSTGEEVGAKPAYVRLRVKSFLQNLSEPHLTKASLLRTV